MDETPSGDSYRDWTREVRSSAQQRLRDLRAARLARRRARTEATPERPDRDQGEPLPLSVSREINGLLSRRSRDVETPSAAAASETVPERPPHKALDPVTQASPAAPDPSGIAAHAFPETPDEDSSTEPLPGQPSATPADTPAEDTASQDAFDDAGGGSTGAVTADTRSQPRLEPELEASDLNQLPGAGIGLVWLLHQCDVRSLADLAEADPAVLSQRLGLIGQLLEVDSWIAFAAKTRDTQERASIR